MLRELITCTPGVSAPAQSRAQSFTWCSPFAPHAELGSKLGAQSCRTDHIRWFRLVGDPRLFAQPSRDRSTRAYIYITPRPVVQTTLGGSDSWAGSIIEFEIWALYAAVQVTLGDSWLPDYMLLLWVMLEHLHLLWDSDVAYSQAWMAYFGAWLAYLYIRIYVHFLGSIQVLRQGVRMYFAKEFSKSFVFAHSRFCFCAPPGSSGLASSVVFPRGRPGISDRHSPL